jgi:excinuclease ABC subunit A
VSEGNSGAVGRGGERSAHIVVKGARENNLRNVDVQIPRDQFVVVTGVSGSGKSSLAFETIYAEGQRKFLESLSSFARRFVSQLKKPAVDFIYGLSPVVSIEQKTVNRSPRSTVGTMTEVYDHLRVLYSAVGQAHCPRCERAIPNRTTAQILDRILSLPDGATVEVLAPLFKVYGEDWNYVFSDVRSRGYRRVRVNGDLLDISEEIEMDEARTDYEVEAVCDRITVRRDRDRQVADKPLLVSLEKALKVGEGFLRFRVEGADARAVVAFHEGFTCPEHGVAMGEIGAYYFSFNEPESACVTCSGLGTYLQVHPDLLVPDKSRSIRGGVFIPEAFKYDRNSWGGRLMYSLADHYGFSLDAPFRELSPEAVDLVLYGTKGERFDLKQPPGATEGEKHLGKPFRFDGIINDIERRYRRYRKENVANAWMENYLRRVMVEHLCPDCGGRKLKASRLKVTLNGRTIQEVSELPLSELRPLTDEISLPPGKQKVGEQVIGEINARLDLLIGIGVDYLSLSRNATTLSGGESQRVRLSTQIGSGLMGMLYVLDEPSIGLHSRDNVKMIETLRRLRDIGNSVVVVEHDEETIRAADHVVEIGPGPGVHGGRVVAQGTPEEIARAETSLTGRYLSGRAKIPVPAKRRTPKAGKSLVVRGARENNLKSADVEIPLGVLLCVTGVSGSGKSTLVNDILYKKLASIFEDSRVLPGKHDALEGAEHLTGVVDIDQSPIGRTPRSNPATYVGIYDNIRTLFAETEESKRRGYTASRFSFNVRGGRCEDCGGEGVVTTSLQFMPDVEAPCQTCMGARYNEETLEVRWQDRDIAQVLDLPLEECADFFKSERTIAHKLRPLNELGLGYVKLGQASTTLSGGESQRVKIARELGKIKRGAHTLYILDEPTTGLHLADIQRLLDCLNRLVDAGNTVLVIEHHMDVIKTADWVIDLGPDGGHGGGLVVASGPPEAVAAAPDSHTGRFLRDALA